MALPVRTGQRSLDALDQELARLHFGYSMPPKKAYGVKLTPKQYSRLLELRGAD